jgi:hypothetical protein
MINRKRERSLDGLQLKLLLPLLFLLNGLEPEVTEEDAGNQDGDDKYRHDAPAQPGLQYSVDHMPVLKTILEKIENLTESRVRK